MNQEPLLKIRDISFSYGDGAPVLDRINTDIYPGECIAVIGSNGAGKSTFFLCMNGVLQPDSGTIELNGEKIHKKNIRELRKKVGIVFQDADSQIIASTVSAEVSFGPLNLRLPKEEVKKRTRQALEYMNLQGFEERPPHELSGGEKKRVTIADIIAMEPDMIIFDEPTTALDPANQQMLEDVLARISSQGKTLLISTHDVDFAWRFAKRILVFSEGKMIADGMPADIFSRDDILDKAHLRKPLLFSVYEILVKKGLLKAGSSYPNDIASLTDLL